MQVKFSWRLSVLALVVLVHAFVLGWLVKHEHPPQHEDDTAMLVEFIDAPIVIRPPPVKRILPPNRHIAPRRPVSRTQAATPLLMIEPNVPTPAPPPKSLFGSDGRLRLPADLMEQIDRKFGDQRQFDFQVPHMDDAAKFFDRPTALVVESTRFEQYWAPDRDLSSGCFASHPRTRRR